MSKEAKNSLITFGLLVLMGAIEYAFVEFQPGGSLYKMFGMTSNPLTVVGTPAAPPPKDTSPLVSQEERDAMNAPQLKANWSWGESNSKYVRADGELRNVSGGTLKNIVVTVTVKDKQGKVQGNGSALAEIRELSPGAKTPFSVLIRARPETSETASLTLSSDGTQLRWEKE